MVNKYYQKNKGKFQKEACKMYQNLSEEEKEKKHKYAREKDIKILLKKKASVLSRM